MLHYKIFCCKIYKHDTVIDLAVQRRNGYYYYNLFCGQIIYLRRLKIVQLFACTNTAAVFLPLNSSFQLQYATVKSEQFCSTGQCIEITLRRHVGLSNSNQTYASVDQIVISGTFHGKLVHRPACWHKSFCMAIHLSQFPSFNITFAV